MYDYVSLQFHRFMSKAIVSYCWLAAAKLIDVFQMFNSLIGFTHDLLPLKSDLIPSNKLFL